MSRAALARLLPPAAAAVAVAFAVAVAVAFAFAVRAATAATPAPAASTAVAAESADRPASAAIEQLRPGWQVLHCGFARGVLYLTYADRGRAAIVAAVPNAAIARACSDAGHALPASAARRGAAAALPAPTPGSATPLPRAPAPPRDRSPPSFTPLALGGGLAVDARNDSDITWRCTVNFSWTSDDEAGAPRSATAQATLPPRQNNRVAGVSGSYRNPRFVGAPSAFCTPAP